MTTELLIPEPAIKTTHAGHEHACCAHDAAAAPAVANSAPPQGSKNVEYTCPMHSQIRQMGPGNCPICGMTLEPLVATAEAEENPELHDMTRRFWVGLVLTVPVFVLEMGSHLFDLHSFISPQTSNWVQLVLSTPVVLWAGWPFFVRAWASVKNRSLNIVIAPPR